MSKITETLCKVLGLDQLLEEQKKNNLSLRFQRDIARMDTQSRDEEIERLKTEISELQSALEEQKDFFIKLQYCNHSIKK